MAAIKTLLLNSRVPRLEKENTKHELAMKLEPGPH